MGIENKNIVNLDLKKEEKILDFSDFQKQNIKFDIFKLQEAYKQITKTKKFDDGGGISHFGAICLTRKPGDPDSVKGSQARGIYWTKPDKSGAEVSNFVLTDILPTGLTFGFILGLASFAETEVGAFEDIGVFLLGLPSCAKVAEKANKIDVAIINFFILFYFLNLTQFT